MKKFKMLLSAIAVCALLVQGGAASAETAEAEVFILTHWGSSPSAGTVTFVDLPQGLQIRIDLRGLPPGRHGFHVHENPSCRNIIMPDGRVIPGGAAGGHFDPDESGNHLGPNGGGHKGDLPELEVGIDGTAKGVMSVIITNVKAADFKEHSVVIHSAGDNYSDAPSSLGGGRARLACGVIK